MKWITTTNLEAWGRTRASEIQLPGLVGDLIRATTPDFIAMRIPTDEKGQVRGFDGVVESNVAALNVPEGKSIWEFGTEADYKGKALSDFKTRTREVSKEDQQQTTLILVTPFTWDSSKADNKIESWIAARKKESAWKDIKLLDGVQLETWLEQCPAVSAQHARNTLNIDGIQGVRSTDEYWTEFSNRFDPRLIEAMLVTERDRAVAQLIDGLMGPPQQLNFIADSPDEVTAFAVAAIRSAKPEVRRFLEARTLVLDSPEAGRELVGQKNLAFLLRGEPARSPGQYAAVAPTLVPLGRRQRMGQGIELERPTTFAMAQALVSMEIGQGRAETLARGCGRSLAALQRQIPGGSVDDPPWIADAELLLPAILAGAWDATNPLDQSVLTALSGGANYSAYESKLRKFTLEADPPLDREGTIFKVRAPMDAFIHAGHLIGPEHLETLRPLLAQVFGRLDPVPEPNAPIVFPSERPERYSDWLRDGLATTVLLIAVWESNARLSVPRGAGQAFAEEAIGSLPGLGSDPRLLTSLKDELPLLAEAAPNVFLSALERMLEGDGAAIRPIFDEVEGFAFPTSNHTGVLWALETIAWDPRWFARAAIVLARLAEIDPGGQLANRPDASLIDMLLLWHPGTNAGLDARLGVLDAILRDYPATGWKVLLRLLPNETGFTSGTRRPRLREADPARARPLTYADLGRAQQAVIERVIAAATGDTGRMRDLLRPMTQFPAGQRSQALAALAQTLEKAEPDDREPLSAALRAELRRHERFAAQPWALPLEARDEIRRILAVQPAPDPAIAASELFDITALERDDAEAKAERTAAVTRLYREHGEEALLTLARNTRMWHLVLEAIEDAGFEMNELESLLRKSVAAEPGASLPTALASIYRRKAGIPATIMLFEDLRKGGASDDTIAALLSGWPDDRATWRSVRGFGADIDESFWRNYRPHWITGSRHALLEVMLRLKQRGRPLAALESALNRLAEVPTQLLLDLLDDAVTEINAGSTGSLGMLDYEIGQIFAALDKRDVDPIEIGRREYALLPLLEHQERPLRLHDLMASDPELFHQIVRDVYRAEDEVQSESDEAMRARWRTAYKLLSGLKQVPGFLGDQPDQAALTSWINRVRALGAATGRGGVTETVIGDVLAHAPADDVDHGWPHRFVRNEIERASNDDLERGLQIERFNMRGVTIRGMFDGGDQERKLAADYRTWAGIVAKWPRTSAMLVRIAESWEHDAEREDLEVRQRRLRS